MKLDLHRINGSEVDFATAFEEIRDFLQGHGADATLDQVRDAVGIDMRQPGLLSALRQNPRVEVGDFERGETLKYRPPFGVCDRRTLELMLSRAVPEPGKPPIGPEGELWEGVRRSELRAEATYDGIDADIDDLLFERRCVRVELGEKPQRDYVLFACPPGIPVTDEVRQLWQAEQVPQKELLQQECIRRGLRTQAEYDARTARRVEARRKAEEAAAAAKASRKRGSIIRRQINTVDLSMD